MSNINQQGHLAYMLGGLVKVSIVHIAPNDPMTSIDQHGHLAYMQGVSAKTSIVHIARSDPVTSIFLNPHYKKDLVSNPD